MTLYSWRKTRLLQGEVVPASGREPEGWGAADKFTVVLETVGLNATELSAYCRERGLFPEQVDRWRHTAQDTNATSLLTLAEQRDLEKLRAQDPEINQTAARRIAAQGKDPSVEQRPIEWCNLERRYPWRLKARPRPPSTGPPRRTQSWRSSSDFAHRSPGLHTRYW